MRRPLYGADRINEDGMTFYNPAKVRVERYRFRGALIGAPYNLEQVDLAGPRFRLTSHDDAAVVGRVSELVSSVST